MLGATPLFGVLSRKELETVLTTAPEVDHDAGNVVIGEGTEGVGFHLFLSRDRRQNHATVPSCDRPRAAASSS